MKRIRVFRFLAALDAFEPTEEYRAIAEDLGLVEWHPVVWIGRLFCMDNDFGEHWLDNWDAREEKKEAAGALGISVEDLLVIDPERFQDGQDGPCNTPALRARFWRDVLESLELSLEVLFEEARSFNARAEGREDLADLYLPDLEQRIARWQEHYSR